MWSLPAKLLSKPLDGMGMASDSVCTESVSHALQACMRRDRHQAVEAMPSPLIHAMGADGSADASDFTLAFLPP